MKVHFQKIICCVLAVALSVSMVVYAAPSASAANVEYSSPSTYWNWLAQYSWGAYEQILGLLYDSVCTESEDEKHHASSYEYIRANGQYKCVCEYCGETFSGEISDFSLAYDSYVDELQTDLGTTTLIDGGYRVYATQSELSNSYYLKYIADLNQSVPGEPGYTLTGYWNRDLSGSTSQMCSASMTVFVAPTTCKVEYGIDVVAQVNVNLRLNHWEDQSASVLEVGEDTGTRPVFFYPATVVAGDPVILSVLPYYDVTPLAGFSDVTDIDISTNSRPWSVPGILGVMNADGTLVGIDGGTIVDEADGTFTNPVTNNTYNYNDYAYDYSDRSYNLTLEDGSTASVVYGDEYITINEGDTIYNIYYLDPGDISHVHSYTSEVTTSATCEVNGIRTYTCDVCGIAYSEPIFAVGHNWVVSESVDATYDENDNLVTPAYTVYSCTVCEETYTAYDSEAPPVINDNGFFSWWQQQWIDFRAWLESVLSNISSGSIGDVSDKLPDEDSASDGGYSFSELLLGLVDGTWRVVKGVVHTGIGGLTGIVSSLSHISDFFSFYDDGGQMYGIVDYGGEDIWD